MTRRLALLIANSVYEDTTLNQLITPEVDVDALALVLRDPHIGGFDEVETLKNESTRTIMMTIARFFTKKKREDLLVLYFSGHGVLDIRGRLYLMGKDTDHNFPDVTAISSAFINDNMDNSRSRQKVLILDCCYSGAFARGTKGSMEKPVHTASRFNGRGRVILTASDATQYAWEGNQVVGEAQISVFTRHLVQGLKTGEADNNADGWITLDEWYDYVYDKVMNETSKQTPGKWVEQQQGSIIIAKSLRSVRPSIQLGTSSNQLIEDAISNRYAPSVVCFFDADSNTLPAGVGFLVSPSYIITCAHVVDFALRTWDTTQSVPAGQIHLSFPLVLPRQIFTAHVIYWLPLGPDDSGEDIAILELETAPPEGAHAGRLVMVDNQWANSFRTFGFPNQEETGMWASGIILGRVANDWIQIEGFSERGFSGSPVWSEQAAGIVGMVAAVKRNSNMAFMIPTSILVKACPQLSQYVVQSDIA